MASFSFDKCWFPLPIINACSFQSQAAARVSAGFGRHGVDYSIDDTDDGCLDVEGNMSEDSEVLVAVSRLAARVLFEPTPKTTEGVAAMVEVLKPKLYQLFGSQSSSGLLLLWDEQFQLAAMAGVVVEKLPGFQDEVPRICYLVVDPDLHGQGFGSMLARRCEDWAAARGHRAIWLFHYSHKARLHHWYSKMGYQTVTHCTATVPVPGQGEMEGTVQMIERDVTLKRKPL